MMTEVELQEGQSAKPDQCGSCKLFDRSNTPNTRIIRGGPEMEIDTWVGLCRWRPPPWLNAAIVAGEAKVNELREPFNRPREVADTDTCDLYRATGATYVQKRRWRVP